MPKISSPPDVIVKPAAKGSMIQPAIRFFFIDGREYSFGTVEAIYGSASSNTWPEQRRKAEQMRELTDSQL
ncbi:MAG: hypothetical protein ACR2N1_05260 [Rubripirellula sp.]